jgi:hypothetical protein
MFNGIIIFFYKTYQVFIMYIPRNKIAYKPIARYKSFCQLIYVGQGRARR